MRNSRSFVFGLTWNCAKGFLGILPLKCARITTPLSHMQFSQIVAFLFPFTVLRYTAKSLMKSGVSFCIDMSLRLYL